LADTLADSCDTIGNVKGEALINSLADTPPEEKAETLGDTMGDEKAKTLVDTLPDKGKGRNKLTHTRQHEERGTGRHDG